MPTLYLDLDDVLCDTASAYLDLVELQFGKRFRLDDISSFNLQHSFGLSDEENRKMFHRAHSPEFIMALEPMAHARPALLKWRQAGYTLAIVTGRHTMSHRQSLEWLRLHDIPYDSFTMVDKYGWEETDSNLAIPLEELGKTTYHLAVEDNPDMARYLASTLDIPVLLHDRPWNRSFHLEGVERFSDWQHLAGRVRSG